MELSLTKLHKTLLVPKTLAPQPKSWYSIAMGRAIEGINWDLLQLKYQKDGLSCREIAEEFGISIKAVEQHCWRYGWNKEKKQVVEKVSEIVVERLVDKRMKAIQEMEDEAIPIARSLTRNVGLSLDSMNGEPIDSAHLSGLANALKVSNHVARLNLGATDPVSSVDLTSGGLPIGHAQAMLQACKKLHAEGKLDNGEVIDVEALVAEHAESKRLESEGK